jgi:hypothetical protein
VIAAARWRARPVKLRRPEASAEAALWLTQIRLFGGILAVDFLGH